MTEPEEMTDETVEVTSKRKFLRVTSTIHLDWPQHDFVLHAIDSGKTNDFAQPEDVPEAVVEKLKGFIRSGHVRFFVATQLEGEDVPTFNDVTPTAEELAEDDDEEAPPAEGETPADPAEPATPAAPAEPAAPAPAPATEQSAPTTTEATASPDEGETPEG